ncbi:zinc finger MYM-type protein 1 [Trichonephila clavipes]|nr:zinc finger MYM-type protein 1 [Trichonephila clavipes]
MWDMLGRRIAARQPPSTYLPELRTELLDEWCNIPQDQIDNLILSMPRRYKQLQEQLRKDTEYYHNVLKRVTAAVKYLAIIGLAFRGTEEVFRSPHNGNFMGALELLDEFDSFICELIEQRDYTTKSLIPHLSKTIYE